MPELQVAACATKKIHVAPIARRVKLHATGTKKKKNGMLLQDKAPQTVGREKIWRGS